MTTDALTTQFYLKLNGSDLPAALMNDLHAVEVDSSIHLPASATLEFYDSKLQWVDDTRFAIGAELEVSILANVLNTTTPTAVFKGVIAAIEPEFIEGGAYAMLVVRAYDKSYLLHRGTKTMAYVQQTDSDIAHAICQEAGLQAEVQATSVVHPHVLREDTSDFDFLKLLANRNGYVAVFHEGKLHFKPPGALGFGEVTLEYGKTLRDFRPMLSMAGQVNEVTVQGWDPKTKQAVTGQATSAAFVSSATGITGQRGYAMARSAHGAKSRHITDAWDTQAANDVIAKAVLDRLAANDMTGEGTAFGNPLIKAGGQVNIQKLGTRFSGKYFVTRVRHRLDPAQAYDTEFWFGGMNSGTLASMVAEDRRGTAPLGRPLPGLMTAVVTNNNDPDSLWRVKLKYPQLADDQESFWAPVVSVGAGPNRGLMVLPEVNDEVVVGFVNGDINRPFVLGNTWNGSDAAPESQSSAVQSGAVEVRTFKTRAGHILRFTDTSGSEKIELIDKKTSNSIVIDTANDTITIKAGKDIVLEATGDIKLKGVNIKLEGTAKVEIKAPTVEAKADAQIKLAGAMAELSASGITKVSGSMVNIN